MIYRLFIKRALDIMLSVCAVIVLLPVYLILSVLILIFLGRPIVFSQKRPGKNCSLFSIYKFRTMKSAPIEGEIVTKGRLNAVGRFIRRIHIDETLEFFNVIRGDMSIVGPRPLLVFDMLFFDERIMKRQSVMPGITGLAQSNGKKALAWDKKFAYDIEYTENITLINDVRIIFKTVFGFLNRQQPTYNEIKSAECENYADYLLMKGKINKKEYKDRMLEAVKIVSRE